MLRGTAPSLLCPCEAKHGVVLRPQPRSLTVGLGTALPKGAEGHRGTSQPCRATQVGPTELCFQTGVPPCPSKPPRNNRADAVLLSPSHTAAVLHPRTEVQHLQRQTCPRAESALRRKP